MGARVLPIRYNDVAGRAGLSEPNKFPYAFPTPGQAIDFSQFVPYGLSTISPKYDVPLRLQHDAAGPAPASRQVRCSRSAMSGRWDVIWCGHMKLTGSQRLAMLPPFPSAQTMSPSDCQANVASLLTR